MKAAAQHEVFAWRQPTIREKWISAGERGKRVMKFLDGTRDGGPLVRDLLKINSPVRFADKTNRNTVPADLL